MFNSPLRPLKKKAKRVKITERNETEKERNVEQEERSDESESPSDISEEEEGREATFPRKSQWKSARSQHIDVLVTLLHDCILRADWDRAMRAYSLLIRCKHVEIRLCYDLGLEILQHKDTEKYEEFLQRLIVAYPPVPFKTRLPRAEVFVPILVVHRIKMKQWRKAMEELEEWLLVPPYSESGMLWEYSSMIAQELASDPHLSEQERRTWERKSERAAMQHERLAGG